jgi:hypothetical protein
MNWWDRITHAFPVTSDVWWTVVSALGILFFALFMVGESLWLLGVRNFTAYTWYIRYSIPRPLLITLAISFFGLGVFVLIHFVWGHGWKTGPNS